MLVQTSATLEAPPRPDLSDAAEQAALSPVAAKAVIRLAGIWGLSTQEICALLGGISERTWYRMKKTSPDALSQDLLTRASVLTGIFKALRLLFSEPLSNEWIRRANRHPAFAGKTPLTAMVEGGIPKMLEVRALLDALRGGA